MKTLRICLVLSFSCLLFSCEEKQSNPSGMDQAAPAHVNSSSPTPAPKPPVKAKVNVGQLNQQLNQAISLKDYAQGLAAIEAGADPHAKDRYGLPVIFRVAQYGNGDMIKALVAKGADPNSKIGTTYNDDGVGYGGTQDGTPLGYAAAKGNLEAMQALVEAGADVNGGGKEGTTPLMLAVDSGKFAVVEWLVTKGAVDHNSAALKKIGMTINPDPERKKMIELLEPNKP